MQDADQAADEWVTPADLAKEWNVSPRTLANRRSRGEDPRFSKLGPGRYAPVRYRRSEINSFVRSSDDDATRDQTANIVPDEPLAESL